MKKRAIHIALCVLMLSVQACILGSGSDDNKGTTTFTMKFEPESVVNPGAGNKMSVDIVVNGAVNLIAARFTVTFDPSILTVSDVSVSGYDYLFEEAGATVNEVERTIDNTTGKCTMGIGGIGKGFLGATGEGFLASIEFTAKTSGATTLNFSTVGDDTIMSVYSPGTDTLMQSTVQVGTATVTAAVAQ